MHRANVQAARNEFIDSCNKAAGQASAKFANGESRAKEMHETAKATVGGAGHEFDNLRWTIPVSMNEEETAVARLSVRMSALVAHATKVTPDQVNVDIEIKAIMWRSAHWN